MYCRKVLLKPKKGEKTKKEKYVWECTEELPRDPVTGKRKRISARGKTKPEAKSKVEKKLKEVTEFGLTTDPEQSTITFEDLAKSWLDTHKNNIKHSAYRSNQYHVKRFGKYLAKIKARDITKKTYQNVIDQMYKDGYALNTIYSAHAVAKKIFRQAILWDILKSSPADMAVLPKETYTVEDLEKDEMEEKYLEREELKLFLETVQEKGRPTDDILFVMLAFTGMRVGELCALKWSDVDFDNKEFSITKTIFNIDGSKNEYKILTPKTKKSIRKITFDDKMAALLKKHRLSQREQMMARRNLWHDGNFIVTREDGYPLSPRFVHYRLKRLEKILVNEYAFKKKLHPHIFRHTHTAILTEEGVDLRTIMQRLGHTDAKTTLAVYTHITNKSKEVAASKLGNVFNDLAGFF